MKQRGSVMVFAIVLVTAMTSVICATVWLTSSLVKSERVYEDQVRARYAAEAITEQAAQDFTNGTMTLPSTRTPSVTGVTSTVTATDNSSNIPHTMSVTATSTIHGHAVTVTKIVGLRKAPSPFYYAMFVNAGLTSSAAFVTGSSGINGDVYSNGAISLTGTGNTINGDLESTSTQSVGTSTITGSTYPSATAITFPTVTSTNYSAVANQTSNSGTLNGATFSTTTGAYYLLYMNNASVSISGTFTGKGTVYVNGNATISGPITLGNSSSRVAIIASGTITFSSAGPHSAYFYGGACTISATSLTITKGALVVASLATTTKPITITNDTSVWLSSTEGTNHRLPGFFP